MSVSKHDHAYWQERLLRFHRKLRGMTNKDAVYSFIETACKTTHFGLSTFPVLTGTEKRKRTLAVGEDGIFLFDKSSFVSCLILTF